MDNYRDYFTREELLRVLQLQPFTPGLLGQLGVFQSVPMSSTTFAVEETPKNGGKILTAMPRGAPLQTSSLERRRVLTFAAASYGDQGAVYADEVLNARAAGPAGAKEIIEQRRAEQMARLRRTMDYTHEKLRMTRFLSPGSTEFGSAASGAVIAVQTDATKTRKEIFDKVIVPIEAALDGASYTGIHALCSDGYWSDLLDNAQIRSTYVNWEAAATLRQGMNDSQMFTWGGVTWHRYRGTSDCKIPDNEARFFPVGVQDLAWQAFAPNDTVESVGAGALGQPYYVGSKPIEGTDGTTGWAMSIKSHVVMVWGRPAAIIPVTKS